MSNKRSAAKPSIRIWTKEEIFSAYKAYCKLIDEGFIPESVLFNFSGLVRLEDRPSMRPRQHRAAGRTT